MCMRLHSISRRAGSIFIALATLLLAPAFYLSSAAAAEPGNREVQSLQTDTGVKFAFWGGKPAVPAPTLFVFALSAKETLGSIKYRQSGNQLTDRGFLLVSLDLPCHGADRRLREPEGLAGWRARVDSGEPLVEPFVRRASAVLDYLVKHKYSDSNHVAACGTSRGGFAAMHFAAADARVKCVAGFAPVTDLAALSEFKDVSDLSAIAKLSLASQADRLAGRPVWIAIGDADQRVDTDRAIALSRSLSTAARQQKLPSGVELHVLPEGRGHAEPRGSAEAGAEWIEDRTMTRRLFDGRSFAGWEGNMKMFRIEDGAIVGGTLKATVPHNEFLCTRETFEDFELRACFKVLGAGVNAGIQFRTRRIPNHFEVSGYQADLADAYWGCLYDESRRARILAQSRLDDVAQVLRPGNWNQYVIRCEGPRIQIWINDLKTVDYVEPDASIPRSGIIGLQIHGGPPSEAWYKDIEVRPLPTATAGQQRPTALHSARK